MKTYIIHYGAGGVQRCKGTRALADFIHNLCISYGGTVEITVKLETK